MNFPCKTISQTRNTNFGDIFIDKVNHVNQKYGLLLNLKSILFNYSKITFLLCAFFETLKCKSGVLFADYFLMINLYLQHLILRVISIIRSLF